MGEVTKNIRTFALPNESNTYTFAMSFEYDSWNRILSTTYPDGEFVRYWYNKGAQLRKMSGSYNNVTYNYIDSIYYNKFEKRTKICYGNGTKAEYTYDILQRLSQLKSTSASGVMQRIEYTFDNVNNIQRIDNSTPMLSNGLGGTYRHDYSYDHLYRLTRSTGNWQNNNTNLGYGLEMTYEEDGRIKTKIQNGTTLINGVQSGFSYRNVYSYYANQSHTINRVDNIQNQTRQDFAWDANGNLVFHKTPYPTNITRKLCWDEENRLMAVGDNRYTSYYVYDNGGERTYKLTGPNTYMNINGSWMYFANMDNPTLYTSAYLVANMQGYTKHYYAGSERIASAIGLGGLSSINIPIGLVNYEHKWEIKCTALRNEMNRTINGCLGNAFSCKKTLVGLYQLDHANSGTMLRYFYHPDHLGSSSWITDGSGNAIQHLHYLPFGEDWVNQRNTSWTTPYTFSGKEKDAETGYGYFGARYYDSGLSIWLSVDPMSDKTPFATPYAYCINNPIILHDPDGQDWFVNELTGDIYYDEDLKKGSESCVADGKNIKWLGKNDMFGQSASSAILGNQDIGTIWNWGFNEKVGRAEFKGKDAEIFADRMGYKKVATQTLKYTLHASNDLVIPDYRTSFDMGCSTEYAEKVSYVPKSYKRYSGSILQTMRLSENPYNYESFSRIQYTYASKGVDFSNANIVMSGLLGSHDYTRFSTSCTVNFEFMDDFLKKYPR